MKISFILPLFTFLICFQSFGQLGLDSTKAFSCGNTGKELPKHIHDLMSKVGRADIEQARASAEAEMKLCRITVIIDNFTYKYFDSDSIRIKTEVYREFDKINNVFEKELQTKILVNKIIIFKTQEEDPYNEDYSGFSMLNKLYQSQNNDTNKPRETDIAMVLTQKYMNDVNGVAMYPLPNTISVNISYWDTYIILHELGHNFGSPHTFECNWPYGPIEYCPNEYYCNNSLIEYQPETVMGYCSSRLTFHPYCRDVMRPYIKNELKELNSYKQSKHFVKANISEALSLVTIDSSFPFEKFYYQISTDSTFQNIIEKDTLNKRYMGITATKSNANYFLRVKAVSNDETDWSHTLHWKTDPNFLPAPKFLQNELLINTSTTDSFIEVPIDKGVTFNKYLIRYKFVSLDTRYINYLYSVIENGNSIKLNINNWRNLPNNPKVYFQVKIFNNEVASEWSEYGSVVNILENKQDDFTIQAHYLEGTNTYSLSIINQIEGNVRVNLYSDSTRKNLIFSKFYNVFDKFQSSNLFSDIPGDKYYDKLYVEIQRFIPDQYTLKNEKLTLADIKYFETAVKKVSKNWRAFPNLPFDEYSSLNPLSFEEEQPYYAIMSRKAGGVVKIENNEPKFYEKINTGGNFGAFWSYGVDNHQNLWFLMALTNNGGLELRQFSKDGFQLIKSIPLAKKNIAWPYGFTENAEGFYYYDLDDNINYVDLINENHSQNKLKRISSNINLINYYQNKLYLLDIPLNTLTTWDFSNNTSNSMILPDFVNNSNGFVIQGDIMYINNYEFIIEIKNSKVDHIQRLSTQQNPKYYKMIKAYKGVYMVDELSGDIYHYYNKKMSFVSTESVTFLSFSKSNKNGMIYTKTQHKSLLYNPCKDLPKPVIENQYYFENTSTTLEAKGCEKAEWQWNNNIMKEETAKITLNPSANTVLKVTCHLDYCAGKSTNINLQLLPSVFLKKTTEKAYCQGEKIELITEVKNSNNLYKVNQKARFSGIKQVEVLITQNDINKIEINTENIPVGKYWLKTIGNIDELESRDSVLIEVLPAAEVTLSGPTAFCDQNIINLTAAANTIGQIEWYQNNIKITENTVTLKTNAPGVYLAKFTNEYGCNATSNSLELSQFSTPKITLDKSGIQNILPNGNITINANMQEKVQYQWYKDNQAISNATLVSYTVNLPGQYYLKATNGVCSASSDIINVIMITANEDPITWYINAFPNPVDSDLNLESTLPILSLDLMDIYGKKVNLAVQKLNVKKINLQLHGIAKGVYFIKATATNGLNKTFKFVKN